VFLGHINITPILGIIWLQSFHIPLFFVCSGLVFSTRKYPKFPGFLKAQVKGLLVPYVTLGITLFFLICLADMWEARINGTPLEYSWTFKDMIAAHFFGYRQHDNYFSLWFLTTLFAGKVVFYFVTKLFKEKRILYILLSMACVALQWKVFQISSGFYWSVDLVPACLAFISIGYCFKLTPEQDKAKICSFKFLPVAMIASCWLGFANYFYAGRPAGLYSCVLGHPVLYYLGAVVGSWMVMIFSRYLGHNRFFEFLGRNSLTLYAYQNKFSIVLPMVFIQKLAESYEIVDIQSQWVFVVFFSIAIGSLLSMVINKCFPWFLGKPYRKKTIIENTLNKN